MNSTRLAFQPIIDRITTGLADASIYVSSVLDPQYLTKFGKVWPAVWISAQRFLPTDDGRGITGLARQRGDVQILVRLIVQRYTPSPSADADTRLGALYNGVCAAVYAWQHPDAEEPFTFQSAVDGPSSEAVCSLDIIFKTQAIYQRTTS